MIPSILNIRYYFNPRTCVGANEEQYTSPRVTFQSTHHVRCDANASLYPQYTLLFQSTYPCGVRQSVIAPLVASLVLMPFQISHWLSDLITGPRLKHERSICRQLTLET